MDYQYIGDCHHIAIAINRIYGHPIVVFYGERSDEDGFEEAIMIHCGVDIDGEFADFSGKTGLSLENAFEEYIEGNQPYDFEEISHHPNENCTELKKLIASCGANVIESKIEKFQELIKEKNIIF